MVLRKFPDEHSRVQRKPRLIIIAQGDILAIAVITQILQSKTGSIAAEEDADNCVFDILFSENEPS